MENLKVGLNKRVCAFSIDFLILLTLELITLRFASSTFYILIWVVFFALKDSFNGQSLGKRFVGIQVVDNNNLRISFLKSLLRNLLFLFPMFFVPIILIEYVVMSYNSLGRRIGDMIARTSVRDLRPDQSDSKYRTINFLIFFVAFFFFSYYVINLYQKAGEKEDASYINDIKTDKLPDSLRGASKIMLTNGGLQIFFDPSCRHDKNDTGHEEYVSSKMVFTSNEKLPANGTKPQYAYNDKEALASVLIYSLLKGNDRHISIYEENLFLNSFDGKVAKFILLIAKRRGGAYNLILKKVFDVKETH